MLCRFAFLAIPPLPSIYSAAGSPALFANFIGTTSEYDFSSPFIIGFGSSPSRCGPPVGTGADGQVGDIPVPVQGPCVHARFYDHVGLPERFALAHSDVLPSATQTASTPGTSFLSRLNGWPAHTPADASPTSSRMSARDIARRPDPDVVVGPLDDDQCADVAVSQKRQCFADGLLGPHRRRLYVLGGKDASDIHQPPPMLLLPADGIPRCPRAPGKSGRERSCSTSGAAEWPPACACPSLCFPLLENGSARLAGCRIGAKPEYCAGAHCPFLRGFYNVYRCGARCVHTGR